MANVTTQIRRSSGTVGVVVIGKAPRHDIGAVFEAAVPPGGTLVQAGCLDALSEAEILELPPRNGADTLYTRLPSGRDVAISKDAVIAHAPDAFRRLKAQGASALVFACSGAFPAIPGGETAVFPSRLLSGVVEGLLPSGRLGILVPLPEQAPILAAKWRRPGLEVHAEPLKPSAHDAEIEAAAERLAATHPDLVVMDCMSYTPPAKHLTAKIVGVPTLLANATISYVIRAMLA